ncbi:hypothetical protein NDA01_20035 [Trichocoleus desertorum AS-A10]
MPHADSLKYRCCCGGCWSDRAFHQIQSNPVLGILGGRVKKISLKQC